MILLDTSILLEYYRKQKKERSVFLKLIQAKHTFSVSVITEYEILIGSDSENSPFWRELFNSFTVIPVSSETINEASKIYKLLKKQRQLIPLADILIGATAIEANIPIATLNKKHFSRIKDIELVDI